MKICVVIATTAGPALIERITPEFAPQSMVCLGRSSEVLAISHDYDDFVRPGSGVIMREFSKAAGTASAFRLDLSQRIGTGKSWQLAVFCAHALHFASDCTLSNPQEAETILWLTGMVDYDLNIAAVGNIAEKVDASRDFLISCLDQGKRVVLGAHPENAKEFPAGFEVIRIARTQDLLAIFDLSQSSKVAEKTSAVPVKIAQRNPLPKNAGMAGGTIAFGLFASLALAAIGYLFWPTHSPSHAPVLANQTTVSNKAVAVPFTLEILSDRGARPVYHFGEQLPLKLRLGQSGWVYCFYRQADGQVLQIYPNPQVSQRISAEAFSAGVVHTLTQADGRAFEVRIGPPAGQEVVLCLATSRNVTADLPKEMQGQVLSPLPVEYGQSVSEIFDRLSNVSVAKAELVVTIKP